MSYVPPSYPDPEDKPPNYEPNEHFKLEKFIREQAEKGIYYDVEKKNYNKESASESESGNNVNNKTLTPKCGCVLQ